MASRVISLFSPVGFEYQPEISLNPWVALSRFFDNPEKRQVWWWSFASFSFLPLLSPGAVLAIISDLAQYFATGDNFIQMWTPYKHHRAIWKAASAAVATQQNFVPHLSHRNRIYLVWPRVHDVDPSTSLGTACGHAGCWWLDFDKRAEYLVGDTRPDQWLTQTLETTDHWLSAIGNMEKMGKIKLHDSVGSARLYEVTY